MAKRRKIESWISRLADTRTEEELFSISQMEVSRNLQRIVDDICNNRIDYQKYGRFLLIPAIFENLFQYCNQKLADANVSLFALNYINSDIEKNMIKIGSLNHIGGTEFNSTTYPLNVYDFEDMKIGRTIITDQMRRDIIVRLQDVIVEQTKYYQLCVALLQVQQTKNIFQLQWGVTELNKYIKANKKLNI